MVSKLNPNRWQSFSIFLAINFVIAGYFGLRVGCTGVDRQSIVTSRQDDSRSLSN